MDPTVFGLENEYNYGTANPGLRPLVRSLFPSILEILKRLIPAVRFIEQPLTQGGLMTAAGGRFYVDGAYMEYATPETRRPEDAVAHQRAGELLLLQAFRDPAIRQRLNGNAVTFMRAATDYQGHYYGMHVNVMLRKHSAKDLVSHLVPFLVTRFYACAGGFGPRGFQMSQKSASVEAVASDGSRTNRAIVNLREKPNAAPPAKRIHLTHQDATMSELNVYLTAAVSALVLRMLDEGAQVGPALTLADPIGALRALDSDPTGTTPLLLACGETATALQIQKHYLAAAEAFVSRMREDWMEAAISRWRDVVERLENDPRSLSDRLDPYIKHRLYSRMLRRRGMTMQEFSQWCGVLTLLEPHVGADELPRRGVRERIRELTPSVTFELLEDRMERDRLSWSALPAARGIWQEMRLTDLQYHAIGEGGLYWRLRAEGGVNSRIVTHAEIQNAMRHPPEGTRAWRRGTEIAKLQNREVAQANWMMVQEPGRRLVLNDPVRTDVEWIVDAPKASVK